MHAKNFISLKMKGILPKRMVVGGGLEEPKFCIYFTHCRSDDIACFGCPARGVCALRLLTEAIVTRREFGVLTACKTPDDSI